MARSERGRLERKLFRAARRGDVGARARLTAANLDLVRSIASRYRGYGLPLDDLVQEGSIGLLDAIDHFDPSRGAPFEAYARFRVRRAIRNALTDQSRLIRLPKQIVERRRAIDRAESRLLARGDRPTPADLAAATGLSVRAVVEAREATAAPISLDEPVLPDGSPLERVVTDPAASDPECETLASERRVLLREALARLPERKRHVVAAQWGLGGTRPSRGVDLAAELELSPRRAQTIGRDALRDLRDLLDDAAEAF